MTKPVRLLSIAVLLMVAAGCTNTPGVATMPDGTSTTSPSATSALPPRPKEIRLDGITPEQVCALLTEAQTKRLGIDSIRTTKGGGRFDNAGCSFSKATAKDGYGYLVTPTTQEGAEVWLKPDGTVTARIVTAAGYPAVENRRPNDSRGCFVDVSVADGQRLGIQYSYDSRPVPYTPDQLCAKALEMAELATQGLIKLHG
ncbi:DUF3558 domain-containing protein [Crossiella sp. CA198]|uniref:DUF3558 domain-containing protein n=1 Tax=Crossiella sp. CA198 TaxID=3455607 RepID=UPI003F8D44AB